MILFSFTGSTHAVIKGTNASKRNVVNVPALTADKLTEIRDLYYYGVDLKIDSIRLTYSLPSLEKSPYPEIGFADNLPTKMAKIADIQAEYPFVELELFHRSTGALEENLVAIIPLQNKGVVGYADLLTPYLTTGDVKLLGENDEILVRLDANNHSLTDEDWLQIEVDYSCVITGTKKNTEPTDLINLTFDLSERNRSFSFNQGWLYFGYWNQATYPPITLIAKVIKQLNFPSLNLTNSKINSLKGLIAVADNLQALDIQKCRHLKTPTLNEEIKNFHELRCLILNDTPRSGLSADFVTKIPIVELELSNCGLETSEVDAFCQKLSLTGRTGGRLVLQLNNPPSAASQAARDDLISKDWEMIF